MKTLELKQYNPVTGYLRHKILISKVTDWLVEYSTLHLVQDNEMRSVYTLYSGDSVVEVEIDEI